MTDFERALKLAQKLPRLDQAKLIARLAEGLAAQDAPGQTKQGAPPIERAIKPHGGYKELHSYRAALVAFDGTFEFCRLYLNRFGTRTVDQMEQAARSGKQNIVEGSRFAGTSTKSELKLLGVARGSLEELLEDYQDYLRGKGLRQWQKDEPEAREVRKLAYIEADLEDLYEPYRRFVEKDDETAANAMICVVHQANYLLDRQKAAVEQEFLEEGGFTERLYTARKKARGRSV